jgi:aminopeptidase N
VSMKLRAFLAIAALLGGRSAADAAAPPERSSIRPTRYELDLGVDFKEGRISGSARITLENSGASPVREAFFLLYRLMTVTAVQDEKGGTIPFRQAVVAFQDEPRRQTNHVLVPLDPPLQPGKSAIVKIDYGGYLAGYVETGSLYIKDRVDEAFTIIREDADAYPTVRLPSYAANRAAGLPEFDYRARITVPESHVVANGGALVERTVRDGRATYVYRNIKPAWRMDFAIARFGTLERPGLRIFYLPEDSSGAKRVLEAASASMALYKEWFGPLRNSPEFTVIEIPNGWGSQADVTSILQAAAAFRDPARLHEVYHEISHLWNVPSLDRPYCRWDEGLATFLEDLTQGKLDGAPLLDNRAEKMAQWLIGRAGEEPRLKSVPMIGYGKEGITDYAYSAGMLMFYALYRFVGQDSFNAIVGGYYQKYQPTGATTAQFVSHAQTATGRDLAPFFNDWLYSTRWYEILASGVKVQDLADRYRKTATPVPIPGG